MDALEQIPKHFRTALELIERYGTPTAAARATGKNASSLRAAATRGRRLLARLDPSMHEDGAPEGYVLRGVSTMRRTPSGHTQWVKTAISREQQEALARAYWEVFAESLPQVRKREVKKTKPKDVMWCIPVSDTHLGMLAWHAEAGEDADLQIISNLTMGAVAYLADSAPEADLGVIEILGDFLHFDSHVPVTSRGGNVLDSDSRYAKVFEAALSILRSMISKALERVPRVEVAIVPGNHDEVSASHLAIALTHIYGPDDRVRISPGHGAFKFVEFGDIGIMVTHGDKMNFQRMQEVFAASDVWCRTKFRYVHSGHVHKDVARDSGACLVESFRVIIPPDGYAASHGFASNGRELRRVDYHRHFGRISTAYANAEMIKKLLTKA